jgi:hypothetical protein
MASVDNPTPAGPDAAAPSPQQRTDVTTAPAGEAAIPLPPPAEPPPNTALEALRQAAQRLDLLLAVAVIALGFLVASFRAANSDFLRHAAAGRLLAEGHYSFGSEPFTWGASGQSWVNTSWLYDLISYLLYQGSETGGIVVVVLKAAGVAFLALLMLRVARTAGRPLFLPACCVGLALLAFSPYALLQPSCLSAVFLGATLWLLRHPQGLREACPTSGSCTWSFWLLPLLFALWANLDGWFFLGPLTAVLYLVGESLAARNQATASSALLPAELKTLWIATAAGFAACCLNPFGPAVFLTLPPELTAGAAQQQAIFAEWFLTPFSAAYFDPAAGLSAAGMAYILLLVLGAISFIVLALRPGGLAQLVSWRFLVWLAFAVLSGYRARGIAFFAVVAGPITARNLSDCFARRTASEASTAGLRLAIAGRLLALLAVVAAIVAAVPGWLQATPHAARRLAFGIEIDPSLRQTAETIQHWRDRNLIPPDTNCLTLSPDAANYLAWFASGARGFIDDRLPLFGDSLHNLPLLRRNLGQDVASAEQWRDFLRLHHVRFLLLSIADRQLPTSERTQVLRLINALFGIPHEWTVCELQDGAVVFGWRDPQQKGQAEVDKLRARFDKQAFGADAVVAPEAGPDRPPQPRPWWTDLYEAPLPLSPATEEAQLHFLRFRAAVPIYASQTGREWHLLLAACQFGQSMPLVATPASQLLLLRMNSTIMALQEGKLDPREMDAADQYCLLNSQQEHYRRQDHGPPEALFLAVRRARQAVLVNPDDARAHIWLAQAYDQLAHETREAFLSLGLQELANIRRTQLIAEATRALRSNPSPAIARDAHQLLVRVYSSMPTHRDVLIHHLRDRLQAMRAAGRAADEDPLGFAARLEAAEKELEAGEKELEQLRAKHTNFVQGKPLLEQARLALFKFGLAERALDLLRNTADIGELMDQNKRLVGRDLIASLLLETGELEQVAEVLGPESAARDPDSERLELQYRLHLAAALGDYARARACLDKLVQLTDHHTGTGGKEFVVRAEIAKMLGQILLREAVHAGGVINFDLWRWPPQPYQPNPVVYLPTPRLAAIMALQHASLARETTEYQLLHAWLALEEGAIADVKRHLDAGHEAMAAPQQWLPLFNRIPLSQADAAQLNQLLLADAFHRDLERCLRGWLARADR